MEEEFILTNPISAYRKLSMPLVFFAIFAAFYRFIDLFWATLISQDALVAIGISAPIFLLISAIGRNIGQGTNAVMSRFQGAYDLEKTTNAFLHGIIICIIISVMIPVILFFCFNQLLLLMKVSISFNYIYAYLFPLALSSFVFIFTLFFAETIISEGDSKRPTIFLIIGSIVNIILDPIFAFYLGFGVVGLSYTTIIGSIIPFLQLIYVYYKNTKIKIVWDDFQLDYGIISEIFKVALPNMIDTFMLSVLGISMNAILISSVGPIGIAIYVLFQNLTELITSPTRGGARGLLTIVGHLLGAKDIDKIRSLFKYSFKFEYKMNIMSIVLFVAIFIIIFFFFESVLNYIAPNLTSNHILNIIIFLVLVCVIMPIVYICSHILNGLGKSIYSLVNTIIVIVLMIAFSYLLSIYTNFAEFSVLISIVCAETIISFIYLFVTQKVIRDVEKSLIN